MPKKYDIKTDSETEITQEDWDNLQSTAILCSKKLTIIKHILLAPTDQLSAMLKVIGLI